jgi:homoserine kinase type II
MSWHHSPPEVTRLAGGVMSATWAVDTAAGTFVARLVSPTERGCLEAGLAAVEHLRSRGIDAGVPVRTLAGALTADTEIGVLALLRVLPGRALQGDDPLDQQWWGDLLGAAHRALDGLHHTGPLRWPWLRPDAAHLAVQPWLRPAVAEAVAATTRLTVTDRLSFGVLHGDPAPGGFRVDPATGRTGLVGWGRTATGPLVYDLATAVAYAGGPDRAGELIDGFTAAGAVAREEIEAALPVLLRFRFAVQADWFARRLATADLTGLDDAGELLSGLHQARAALGG